MEIFIFICFSMIYVLMVILFVLSIQVQKIEEQLENWDKHYTLMMFKKYRKQGINTLKIQLNKCERYLYLCQEINNFNLKYNILAYYIDKDIEKQTKSCHYYMRCLKYLITNYFIKKKINKEV